jgi:acyl-CoA thioesterase FadM
MSLVLRLLWVVLRHRSRSRCDVFGPCATPFRVMPSDLDVLLHVNNGVYLSILDAARVDMMLRSGFAWLVRRAGYYPVVAAETIRFRRSLKAFERFDVHTRVLGWDDKAFLLEHRFMLGEVLAAEAFVRVRFLKKSGGSVDTAPVLELAGKSALPAPELPDWVAAWNVAQTRSQTASA